VRHDRLVLCGDTERTEGCALAARGRDSAPGRAAQFEQRRPTRAAVSRDLAEKHRLFLSEDPRDRIEALQWLFWQVGGLGPMAGQIGHFNVYAPAKIPYAIERYTREIRRLYGVLDRRLADREFLAGCYSIADMACHPWIVPHHAHGQNLDDFVHLRRWFAAIADRPATRRAYMGVEDVYVRSGAPLAEAARQLLFGGGSAGPSLA